MTTTHHAPTEEQFDASDPALTRFDLVREGARRDGVEIVHYAPRFPVPGTKAERRVERVLSFLFLLTGLFGTAFVVAYIWWPWHYGHGDATYQDWYPFYTPVLGATLGLCLLTLGLGIITWSKKLLPEEVSIQERHDGHSDSTEQKLTAATILNMGDELGLKRRKFVGLAFLAGAAPLGAVAGAVLVGSLIKAPKQGDENIFFTTGWDPKHNDGKPVRLTHEDGTPIRPADVSVGGQITVFPGIPHGATNKYADSPTLLIHLREQDAQDTLKHAKAVNEGSQWQNFVAYSKICTHAGCPASLYEQQTNRLLCPCHQSQFQITDNARPIFGPASRALPQLPITVDDEGYFVAKSDYKVAIGPAFWERP
ncbi:MULTISPECIES: cytochrome bc1 complex Rieske iron-sulfur subunit [Dactylosporangium]|uniref:Cytochrome bc1 complex Rieske iron-sulfur subunit n=2 Tax=Dactylosporangium TaxID=35753 RepID=A0A9W6KK22_9ACTN|nr:MULTISPECIES: Rieske 2Fe-2S domain-containing protein [Dactylosporangium]UAB95088.1 Rieske 2Fe-2S domain-containing protein [Dactylosporangium vinaceum]UWZ43456.1 Rieske 2Fe-2S domain-containing protein [Dactylosporangium matsuzakiense]GLL02948.1 ubiquinol-cytochrome c reductase iron-sulfur subunit [Dactylosporangium matsuzakiense]